MKFNDFVKSIFVKSWQDYKTNKNFLTALSFFCIILVFAPIWLGDIVMPTAVSVAILLPGWILFYLCVYAAFFAAKGKKLSMARCIPDIKTAVKSVLVSFAGLCFLSLPFMLYFVKPQDGEIHIIVSIIYLLLSIWILLFAGWITFLCFYGILDGRPLKEVFFNALKYLKRNLFKLFALLFIVLLVFIAADMTIVGLFVVFPFILIIFANIYLRFCERDNR